jgi:23S rRNA (uracil1939-C5)-methyltransferase
VSKLEIEALAAGGRGVGRAAGTVWFVPGAVPGDLVLAEPQRRRKRFVEGKILRLLRPSAARREPPCEFQGRCGGCPWMVLGEGDQATWKRRTLLDALERVGRLCEPPVEPLIAPGGPTGYRNKVEFGLGQDRSGRPAVGLHSAVQPGRLVDLDCCLLQHEAANEVLRTARRVLLDPPPAPGERGDGPDRFRLVLRRSWSSGRIVVVLRESARPFPRSEALVRAITASHTEVSGVVRVRARPGRRGGALSTTLFGVPWLEERLGKHEFRLPPSTFLQVNGVAAAELVRLVIEAGRPHAGDRVLDLYGGVGVYGLALLAQGAGAVEVCDADGAAVACGRAAARKAGRRGIRFHQADAGTFLAGLPRGQGGFDLLVANPPRTGLGPGVAKRILDLRPARIVMVSCDPATLARDLRDLVGGGYGLQRVTPLDMFPQTAHVEAVATLSDSNSR